jgi:hypothetical protein
MSGSAHTEKDLDSPVIVDLGHRKRTDIKKLCQGEGPLVEELKGCLEELKTSGAIPANAVPVILVVRSKAKQHSLLWPAL